MYSRRWLVEIPKASPTSHEIVVRRRASIQKEHGTNGHGTSVKLATSLLLGHTNIRCQGEKESNPATEMRTSSDTAHKRMKIQGMFGVARSPRYKWPPMGVQKMQTPYGTGRCPNMDGFSNDNSIEQCASLEATRLRQSQMNHMWAGKGAPWPTLYQI